MKRLFFLFALLAATLCCQAQHLEFMGIPIDGSIKEFDAKILEKGFETNDSYNSREKSLNNKWYGGMYAGYDVIALVRSTPKSDLVYCVSLSKFFDTEDPAKSMLDSIRTAIVEKYNVLKESPYTAGLDGTVYRLQNGAIVVSYNKSTTSGYRVSVDYLDEENVMKSRDENLSENQ